MSFARRLYNIARAELGHAFRRTRDPEAERRLEEELARARTEAGAQRGRGTQTGRSDPEVELRKYYANLELPYGAPAAEVRAAYRRLIRRYHPDKHHADPEASKVATEITQKLRQAHDGLLRHLGE